MARAIDSEVAYQFLTEQLVKETGAFSKGVNKGLNIARSAMRNPDAIPTLTQPNEWVSVEERLPEPDFPRQQRGFYLVALSNGTVKELMYEFRHYENMMFDVGWHETAFPVTHWMPLPAPPTKEE